MMNERGGQTVKRPIPGEPYRTRLTGALNATMRLCQKSARASGWVNERQTSILHFVKKQPLIIIWAQLVHTGNAAMSLHNTKHQLFFFL